MNSDLKILVAGPKRSGKTAKLIGICYDMNLPFVVTDERQNDLIELESKRLSMPIKIKFVGELKEDGYEGPIVMERSSLFSKSDWRYIQSHCIIYAESREVETVINTGKTKSNCTFCMLFASITTIFIYHFFGIYFAGIFSFLLGLYSVSKLFHKTK